MAEVLGIMASRIAVSQLFLGIIETTQKLHSIWSELQDVPDEIRSILEELDILGRSLIFLEEAIKHQLESGQATSIESGLRLCRKAADDLDDLVSMLPTDMSSTAADRLKMKWRVFYHKDKINFVRERLQRAVRYLSFAVTCYSLSLQTRPPQLQVKHASTTILQSSTSEETPVQQDSSSQPTVMTRKLKQRNLVRDTFFSLGFATFRRESRGNLVHSDPQHLEGYYDEHPVTEVWTLVPMSWSRMKAFSITKVNFFGNWHYTFSSVRVLADDHPVFDACASGDLQALNVLLSSRTATLHDVNDQGETLLHVAALHNQPQMCKWLLDRGLNADGWTNVGLTPLHYTSLAWYNIDQCRDTLQALLEDGLADPSIGMADESLNTPMSIFHGPTDAFLYLQKATGYDYCVATDYTLSWQGGKCYGAFPTKYVKEALVETPITPERADLVDTAYDTHRTLLHAVASSLVDAITFPFDISDTLFILKHVLTEVANVHPQDKYGATPFDYLCYGAHSSKTMQDPSNHSKIAVAHWFGVLHATGINLQDYIEEELRLHSSGVLIHCRQIRLHLVRRLSTRQETNSRLLYLSVSDEPKEPEEHLVPGSWPEINDGDTREMDCNKLPVAQWTLVFDPLKFEVEGGLEPLRAYAP